MIKNEGDRLIKVIVCSPNREYFNIENLKNHNIKEAADRNLAIEQHNKLKAIMKNAGVEVTDTGELPGHPNSVFTRDAAVCCHRGYIKLRMGLSTRRGEEDWLAMILDEIGIEKAGEIVEPGTVEGGDVILAGNVAFIGISGRTNREGAGQISEILGKMGFETRVVEVPEPYLHIGGAMSMLAPDKVLCCKNVFPKGFFKGFETIEAPDETFVSGNVICLAPNHVIADSFHQKTIEILKNANIRVEAIDLSEFLKGTGGPTCLIMPVERK